MKFNTAVPEIVQNVVNEQANSNWRHIKPLIETDIQKYIAEIAYEIFDPIFTKMPIKDFHEHEKPFVNIE